MLYHISALDLLGDSRRARPHGPFEIAEKLKKCPNCGHVLDPEPDPGTIRMTKSVSA